MDDDLHNPTGICCLTIRRSQLTIPTELHSPLTLAASLLRSKDLAVTEQQQKNHRKRLSVFQYLVKALSTVVWKYGPVTGLDGCANAGIRHTPSYQ